jgi:branched-chain amino acid transport system ATP-binding protein
MSLLQVQNVTKNFGGLTAINNVTFDIKKGDIVGLIGPNGAGKTTMFNVINGFYAPSKGRVLFNGKDISGKKPHKICQMGIARTFQVVKPLQRLSVLDNVIASAFVRCNSKKKATEVAIETLKFANLYEDRDVISKGLPLGKRKRLEIARALATKPELILLDESFAGLNPSELNESIEIVRKIKEKGITIMIIEHHMKVIMSISDQIVVLSYGERIAAGTPEEIRANDVVIKAYLGDDDNTGDDDDNNKNDGENSAGS